MGVYGFMAGKHAHATSLDSRKFEDLFLAAEAR